MRVNWIIQILMNTVLIITVLISPIQWNGFSNFVLVSPVLAQSNTDNRLDEIVDISTGYYHSCALKRDRVYCWGRSEYHEGDNIGGFKNAKQIVSGRYHNCVLDDDGVWCWGFNGSGRIDVPGLVNPYLVSAGEYHTCAADKAGVSCWGEDGKLVAPEGLKGVQILTSGIKHSCAWANGEMICWGSGMKTQPPNLDDVLELASGTNFTCALTTKGLRCWGEVPFEVSQVPSGIHKIFARGNLFCATHADSVSCYGAFNWTHLASVSKMSLGNQHRCALLSNAQIKCWGSNEYMESSVPTFSKNFKVGDRMEGGFAATCLLVDGSLNCRGYNSDNRLVPTWKEGIQDFHMGFFHACAVKNQTVQCWGEGDVFNATKVPQGLSGVLEVAVSNYTSCAVLESKITCWGNPSKSPIGAFRNIVGGSYHFCAIEKASALVKCWDSTNQLKVPALTQVRELTAGPRSTCALDNKGLQCWGALILVNYPVSEKSKVKMAGDRVCVLDAKNLFCIGPNNVGQNDTPGDLDEILDFSGSDVHTCALTKNGVRCWGNNSAGQSGNF